MRSLGLTTDFHPQPWPEIHALLADIAQQDPAFQYLVDIAVSVIESERADELAACLSMHDIVITPRPVSAPPIDVVRVRAPGSVRHAPRAGHVRIEHQSLTGHDDDLERPDQEAIALFWRFMIEKFGVAPPCVD